MKIHATGAIALLTVLGAGTAGASPARAQERPPLTIQEAVEFAEANVPAIRAAQAGIAVADSGVDLARTAYLPRTELIAGINRATRNNVYGLQLPNAVLPSISGPVQPDSTYETTFGSAVGALFSWEPFDFGLREANVSLAGAVRNRAEAGSERTELEIALGVVEAYLAAVSNREAVAVAEAMVERMRVFAEAVGVLVVNQLRPGADESRVRAELARAEREIIRAEEEADRALAVLAERTGMAGERVEVAAGGLLAEPPGTAPASGALESHPRVRAEDADIGVIDARVAAIEKEWRPKIELQSSVYGRGSGARLDGTFAGGANGLAPSTGNWAVGLSVRFDLFGYKQNGIRRRIEAGELDRKRAERDQVLQELTGAVAEAEVSVEAARRIARNTPVELEAARTLETQVQARYTAGLGTVTEVAEAERLLRQAEVEDALARLGVWRALFALAGARGDMGDLLGRASR